MESPFKTYHLILPLFTACLWSGPLNAGTRTPNDEGLKSPTKKSSSREQTPVLAPLTPKIETSARNIGTIGSSHQPIETQQLKESIDKLVFEIQLSQEHEQLDALAVSEKQVQSLIYKAIDHFNRLKVYRTNPNYSESSKKSWEISMNNELAMLKGLREGLKALFDQQWQNISTDRRFRDAVCTTREGFEASEFPEKLDPTNGKCPPLGLAEILKQNPELAPLMPRVEPQKPAAPNDQTMTKPQGRFIERASQRISLSEKPSFLLGTCSIRMFEPYSQELFRVAKPGSYNLRILKERLKNKSCRLTDLEYQVGSSERGGFGAVTIKALQFLDANGQKKSLHLETMDEAKTLVQITNLLKIQYRPPTLPLKGKIQPEAQ